MTGEDGSMGRMEAWGGWKHGEDGQEHDSSTGLSKGKNEETVLSEKRSGCRG